MFKLKKNGEAYQIKKIFMFAGMELDSRGIHGQMVQSTLHNAQLSPEEISHRRSICLRRKEHSGGMPIVTGRVPRFMVPSKFFRPTEQVTRSIILMETKQLYSVGEPVLMNSMIQSMLISLNE